MDPALWELLRAEAGTDGDRVLEAIIRLARPGIDIPDVRMVSRFGTIATCRIRARDVIAVRARQDVISIKAARGLSPGFESAVAPLDPVSPDEPRLRPTDVRRSPALGLTGAGVVVAAIDWGVDVDSAAFRWPDDPEAIAGDHEPGATRFLSFWDQRDQATGPRPDPYGYGTVHSRQEIDRALQDPRPYERLGYHPAIADPRGQGTHGTRTMDIAAGNGCAGGPVGIAPDADLIFVHLADRNTGGLANFGDSVRLLEAVDFISRTAGSQPCAINISAGRICGPKNGTALAELAFDELLAATPGRFIANSGGNYLRWRAHSCGTIAQGEARSLTFVTDPADITVNEIEIWYDGADEFAIRIDPPGYTGGRPVRLGERSDLLIGGRVVGRVYHRKHDPNNGNNHIVAYLDPVGRAGNWTVTLEARRLSNGRFHAWIERDDSCPGCQARFTPDDSNPATTIGSIASSHLPLIAGAYDGHDPARPAAAFSSAGPCTDGRGKPDLVAPGVDVLAARSAPVGAIHNTGLLVRGNGTSFATPHVTGAVALCLEAAGNRLSAREIRALVLGSCDPAPDADPECRFGHGYLNIPRLVADVQQALVAPATAPGAKESTMTTEDTIVLLAAAPATAYREYLYRPGGQLARWIDDRFELVARPGRRIDRAPREGDILLEVSLGRITPGHCFTLEAGDPQLVAAPSRLPPGQLLLRPRKRVEMSEPLPVEPTLGTGDLDLAFPFGQGLPENGLTVAGEAAIAEAAAAGETAGRGAPDAGSAEQKSQGEDYGATELELDLQSPARVAAGQLVVDHVPLLRSHDGTPPDMVLTWNAMQSSGTVDVVVHLHGFSTRGRSMQLTEDMVPVSGLDFADPANRSSVGRTSPTLLVLPRGNYFGGRSGRGYNFPALHRPGALSALVDDAFARFSAQAGAHPTQGRVILTAHSGGGASLMRILRYADPDEVHTFDALYTDPSPLITWAQHRIARGSGAMRVLYRPGEGTARQSLAVESAMHHALAAAGADPNPRWRVESTRVPHMDIPARFGWRLLADVAVDLPGAGHTPAVHRHPDEAFESLGEGEQAAAARELQAEEAPEDHEAAEDCEVLEELEAEDIRESDSAAAEFLALGAARQAHEPLTTMQLRHAWAEYLCAGRVMVTIPVLSNRTPVNPLAADAFAALAEALRITGYQAGQTWVYNCRNIEQADPGHTPRASLHAYGLAVDIDPRWNPHRHNVSGPIRFSAEQSQAERQQEVAAGLAGTVFTPRQVAAVEAIRTIDGLQVFGWGGRWRSSHDAMHFEVRLTPAELQRGIAARPVPAHEAEAGPEQETCGAWEMDDPDDGSDGWVPPLRPEGDAGQDSEDNPPSGDRFVAVSSAVRALGTHTGADGRGVLTRLRSLGSVEMCRLGESPDLVGALADHLSGAELAEAGAQLARGRVNSMGRADLGRIIGNPSIHTLGVLAGASGHDVLLAHHDTYDRTGTGTIHGNRSGVPKPAGAVSTDCTEYVLTVLDQVFAAKGLVAEWRAVRRTATKNSAPGGLKGTEVIKALQADRGWQAVFWAPDPRDPADGNSEHPFAYRKVRTTNTYYGITVDTARSVINYRRTKPGHAVDLTGIERLQRLQFGLLAARGGIHLAMIVNGEVHEVHWTSPATSRDAITATPLETFAWLSGVIAAPPDDLDLAWRMP